MQIEIEFGTQVRAASGLSRQTIDLPVDCTLAHALAAVLSLHPKLAPWLEPSGQPRPGLLIFVNDQTPGDVALRRLQPRDQVALMTLVSGG